MKQQALILQHLLELGIPYLFLRITVARVLTLKIPLSSVYKKLTDLENLTLIQVEKYVTTDSGRRLKIYRSRIKKADIIIKSKEPEIQLSAN